MFQSETEDSSSPEERGKRVRRLRNLANLSRQEMCIGSGIKLDTLIGWEVARHGGLTEKGATKVIDRVAQEGVIGSINWLLYGMGLGPTVISNFDEIQKSLTKTTCSISAEEQLIAQELMFFRKNNEDAVELLLTDNAMNPPFNQGDYVAGIKHYKDQLPSLIGMDCIVQPTDALPLLRRIFVGHEAHQYNLVCTNLEQNNALPILSNVTIAYAAPVIWHRKKNPVKS